ncbi:MAG: HPr family phosphocarrier protein [Alphaproteobacteria bacterium]|nr:MAG: HPr family phosphocarrier protein [Alphaproteobacteria bacterium]
MSADLSPPPGGEGTVYREVLTIKNQKGLHARASAKFVKCLERFNAELTVSREGMTVSGTSIMGLMMLAAHPGAHISVEARGPEAKAALKAIIDLVEAKFDED